jgi:hypothetical protein
VLLHDAGGNPGGIGQRRRLAPEGMEVEEQPRCIYVADAGNRQVEINRLASGPVGVTRIDGAFFVSG